MLGTNRKLESARSPRWSKALAIIWSLAVLAGLMVVWQYANTSARATSPDPHWPSPMRLVLDAERLTLVTFVHPHCPCTRASVGELEKIVAQSAGNVRPWVVVFHPSDADDDWSQSDLVAQVAQMTDVQVVIDHNAELARLFDVTTSGHALLYSPGGELLFSGGVTAARGHAGDNVGASAIAAHLTNKPADVRETPVFGCAIRHAPDR